MGYNSSRKEKIFVATNKGVHHGEYKNVYNIFYPSTQNTFIEISVQFEEEFIPDLELALGECSSPPPQDDVSDE